MGVYLSTPNKTKMSETGGSKKTKLKYFACGMQGWRVNMEDAHLAHCDLQEGNMHLFGVFDGHGGREVAKFCEKHFIEELTRNPNFKKGNYGEALKDTFMRMDDLLLTAEGQAELKSILGTDGGENQGDDFTSFAGCTANVSLIVDNKIYCANAGDSRSVLCLKGGEAFDLSKDHKPELDSEYKRITDAGGYVTDGRVNGNLNLSRAIGDLEYKKQKDRKANEQLIIAEPEIKVRDLSKDEEFLLLGCDGVFDKLSNQEIVTQLRDSLSKSQGDMKKTVEDFLDSCCAENTSEGVGCDNMTCILVQLC